MGYNFPNSPATGATFTPSGGPTYIWDGIAWKSVQQGVPVTVYVSDTPPPSPAPGQLWWNSTTGNMAIWYSDPDSAQWVQVSGSVSDIPTAQTRNRVCNPCFQVSQEQGNTAVTASGNYAADQWIFGHSSGGAVSVQRMQVVTPNGSKDRLRFSVTTADAALAAGEFAHLRQIIEGIRVADFRYGTASAKQSVLRFGWKSPAGTYSIAVMNSATNRSYLANFTITAGQANTDTEQVLVIPGDTTGIWLTDTGIGLYLTFCIGTGTTYQGAVGWQAGAVFGTSSNTNGLAANGNTFELFDVSLHLDPLNTGLAPRWEMPDEAQELAACQRYYVNAISIGLSLWNPLSTGLAKRGWVTFPAKMRNTPACSVSVSNIASPGVSPLTTAGALCYGVPGGDVECSIQAFFANARM